MEESGTGDTGCKAKPNSYQKSFSAAAFEGQQLRHKRPRSGITLSVESSSAPSLVPLSWAGNIPASTTYMTRCNIPTQTPNSGSGHPQEDTPQGLHRHRQGSPRESVCPEYFISWILQGCNKNPSLQSSTFPAFNTNTLSPFSRPRGGPRQGIFLCFAENWKTTAAKAPQS